LRSDDEGIALGRALHFERLKHKPQRRLQRNPFNRLGDWDIVGPIGPQEGLAADADLDSVTPRKVSQNV
jgi:hypothetical protein